MIEFFVIGLPAIFIVINLVGVWRAQDDIKEIKHVAWSIFWLILFVNGVHLL
jgi:hypothetical protein